MINILLIYSPYYLLCLLKIYCYTLKSVRKIRKNTKNNLHKVGDEQWQMNKT